MLHFYILHIFAPLISNQTKQELVLNKIKSIMVTFLLFIINPSFVTVELLINWHFIKYGNDANCKCY